jgi:ribosome-associated protein YbcJ (S4-like RNA binding protein)
MITDQMKEPIPSATVIAIDLETNFKYGVVSKDNGFYSFMNLPPSDRYQIEVSFLGFKTIVVNNVVVNLGATTVKDFIMVEENTALNEVVITTRGKKIKSGNEVVLSRKRINSTPTISRSIQDLTKNLAENNLNSFGGASNRFNNLSIDGIANNDVIGFQEAVSGASGSLANGTPGSLARTQPIALGVIKQLSVKLAPFDVSFGNFSGANINLITKNGTNNFKGEVYAFGNNQITVGQYSNGLKQDVPNFYDMQVGAGVGGPLIEDKLFYFVNIEQALSSSPVLNPPGSPSANIPFADVEAIANRLISVYNYDPGSFSDASVQTSSTKIFTRLDYNISDQHKLTLRNNFVNSFADNLEWSTSIFNFGNQGYRHNSSANSLALELKSNWASGMSNTLSLGFNTVIEDRDFDGRVFPHVQIASNSTNRIFAGTYREASVYNTDLYTLQISDKLTFSKENHTFTLGGLAQYNNIKYGFLSAWNGRWEYRSVDDFLNDRPARVRGVYNINNNDFGFVNSTPSATVAILETGLYAQDKYRVSNKFTITAGIRLDAQFLTDELPVSQEVMNTPEFSRFDNKISRKPQFNPRVGFNYTLDDDNRFKLRGGTGLFSGRIPYLWFAYSEYISGTEYFNIDIRPGGAVTPLTENLADLQSVQPNLTEINLIDKDFTIPREWKTNLALEAKLPKRWTLNLEYTYTEVLKGLFFQSINRRDEFANYQGADNRPYYTQTGNAIKINPNFTNVFLLTNTDQGYRYNLTFGLEKETNHYSGYIGYTYGVSKDVSSTVRNSPAANFEWNQAVFGNNPTLSFSNFDLRHKFVSTHSYNFKITNSSQMQVSFLYNGRSGSPFSFIYQGDLNRDGSSRNDLIYVPANRSEIDLVDITDGSGSVLVSSDQQWQNLNTYIESHPYLRSRRGNYVERNGAKTPWNHELDMRIQSTIDLKNGHSLALSLDMLNVLNFLNKDWGRLVFVPNVVNSSFSLLNFVGIQNGAPQYQFNIDPNEEAWAVDLFNSRWRAQLGVRYNF